MSDDYTDTPWGDSNDTNIRDNHWSSNHEPQRNTSEASNSSETTATRSNRAAVANLPYAIRKTLNPHWSAWALLNPEEARYQVASDSLR